MSINRTVCSVLLATAAFVGGCTTDNPLLTNQRAVRLDGIDLYNRTDYENAAGSFRSAVKQDPRDFRSDYFLGLTYERLGNYQQAIQAYMSSIKILREIPGGRDYGDYRQIIMNTTASCIAKHDANGLEQNLLTKQVADLKTDSRLRAESYFLMAKIQRYRRDADSALISYNFAAQLDPNDFYLQKEAGLYLHQMGKNFTAYKIIMRAAKLNSRDPEVNAACRDLNIATPPALIQNETGSQPIFKAPLPAVDIKMSDTPVVIPDQLPVN